MVSIVIPAYKMEGKGNYFLERAIESIPEGCEVIVSMDGSFLPNKLHSTVTYTRNQFNGAASNLNNALNTATGDLIKVLFQDDELTGCDLSKFEAINFWGFCTSKHNNDRADHKPYHPKSIKELALGCNTYGSPSALAFRKTDLRFDRDLHWLLDCDFYARMTMKYGLPDFVDTSVLITEWDGQATNTICNGTVRLHDANYLKVKYANI